MTDAIIINIGICMWNPSVVSWLGEKGCVQVKHMSQHICFSAMYDIVVLKNTDYMDIICHIEYTSYAYL